jgi:hypothetical protein
MISRLYFARCETAPEYPGRPNEIQFLIEAGRLLEDLVKQISKSLTIHFPILLDSESATRTTPRQNRPCNSGQLLSSVVPAWTAGADVPTI